MASLIMLYYIVDVLLYHISSHRIRLAHSDTLLLHYHHYLLDEWMQLMLLLSLQAHLPGALCNIVQSLNRV